MGCFFKLTLQVRSPFYERNAKENVTPGALQPPWIRVIVRPTWTKMDVTMHHNLTGNLPAFDSDVEAHYGLQTGSTAQEIKRDIQQSGDWIV
jgi:hypothetical protein